jgi:alanine racemase
MTANEAQRCWAEVSVDALRHNARVACERIGPGSSLLAVVKANAYGHGLAPVVQALAKDAQLFGVANVQEALAVRSVVQHPVLIMGSALPLERSTIAQAGFIASISSFDEAQEFSRCGTASEPAFLNCAVDTGMGRMGIAADHAEEEIGRIAALPHVRLHSVSTHLAAADEDPDFTKEQLMRFDDVVARVRAALPQHDFALHVLPSAGVLAHPDAAHHFVRAGLMLYGISPIAEFQPLLRPALTWKAHIVLVRELPAGSSISYGRTFVADRRMRVATLSVGYADGLPRALSNRGASVLIGGRRCSILGRVTMDLTMVDVSDVPVVTIGDEVVLIGKQGREEILATEMARCAGTIAWEIFTSIGSRVARVYL